MKLLIVLALVGFATAFSVPKFSFVEEWQLWKSTHGKEYYSQREELERHIVWVSNREYIEQHNANQHIFGFNLAMNHFGDMTDKEFMEKYGDYEKSSKKYSHEYIAPQATGYPDQIDWRTKGAVTAVKNQGDCRASYAFSAVGAVEGAYALARGRSVALSEQNIIDCSLSVGNHGCYGGSITNTYSYILSNDGVASQDKYPFYGKQGQCTYDKSLRVARISGYVSISSGNEANLQSAVASTGPVAVAVDGSNKAFRYYNSGVYNVPGCSSYSPTNHLLVTGYGTKDGVDYWLLKNSWGTMWGQSGYIMMSRNKYNQCGIATEASFPTL